MADQQVADLWALSDLCTPWCIHVVATLRIADYIVAGKDQIDDLARSAGCDPYALHRVLTYLVGKGVFEETTAGRFALNQAARDFSTPGRASGSILRSIGGRMARSRAPCLAMSRQVRPRTAKTFRSAVLGGPECPSGHWGELKRSDGAFRTRHARLDFDITGGWESVRTVVDVGGGTGAMLARATSRVAPDPRNAGRFPADRRPLWRDFRGGRCSRPCHDRWSEFLRPLARPARDLYLLKKIVND